MNLAEWRQKFEELEFKVKEAQTELEEARDEISDFLRETTGSEPGGVATIGGMVALVEAVLIMKMKD